MSIYVTGNYMGDKAYVPCGEDKGLAEKVLRLIAWKNKNRDASKNGSVNVRWLGAKIIESDTTPKGTDIPQLAKVCAGIVFDNGGEPHKADTAEWDPMRDVRIGSRILIPGDERVFVVYSGLYVDGKFDATRWRIVPEQKISYQPGQRPETPETVLREDCRPAPIETALTKTDD